MSRFFRRLRLPTMRRADGSRASAALPGTGGRAGALARPARCAAALLVAFAALLALPLQAQAVDLVSNLNVSSSDNDFKGKVGGDGRAAVAQKFTIPEGTDYILSDVTVNVDTEGDQAMVMTIRRSAAVPPASAIHTLIPPASPGTGWETYTAPSGAVLEGGKSYYVMLTAPSGGTASKVKAVFKNDDTGLEGWSIANAMLRRNDNGNWAIATTITLRIRLRGREVSNNANLSDLELERLNGTAITLTPVFSSSRSNYTASAPNGVSSVDLTATKAQSGATVAIENDNNTNSPNAARLSLDIGPNTLRVTVTAENGREKNYRVVVTRAQPPNIPATGLPAITGVPQAGKVLTAGLGTIADSDGLPSGSGNFTYQWVRVDADGFSNPRNRGTNSPTYTPVAGDAGKKIKVKVSFNDDRGYAEGPLSSLAYPSSGTVVAPKGTCPADSDWCSTLTAGYFDGGLFNHYGFADPVSGVNFSQIPGDNLDHKTIDYGDTTWLIGAINTDIAKFGGTDVLKITLSAYLPRGSVFNLGGTTFTADATSELTGTGHYLWPLPLGFAWVVGQDVTVSVKVANFVPTGAPGISGTAVVGEELTATTAGISDGDGTTRAEDGDTGYAYAWQWIRVDGSTETDISGETSKTYTLVAADDGKKVKVKVVSFKDDRDNAEGPLTSEAYPSSGTIAPVTANNLPVFTDGTPQTRTLAETVGGATVSAAANIGAAVAATDDDSTDMLTYALLGTDKDKFTFDTASGRIKTKVGEQYDYEEKSSYSVTVTVTDDTVTVSAAVTINVTNNTGEPPVAPDPPTVDATAGSWTSLDVSWDPPDNDGRPFIESYDLQYKKSVDTIWTAGPQDVTTPSTSIPGLEAETAYDVQVRATNEDGDSAWSTSETGTTNEEDNVAPVFDDGTSTTRLVDETIGDATVAAAANIGNVVEASDADAGDTLTYDLGGTDKDRFTIDTTNGQIKTKAGESYDYETQQSYAVIVTVNDGNGGTASIDVTINVGDLSEPPLATAAPTVASRSSIALNVSWNPPANQTGRPAATNYDLRYKVQGTSGWTDGPQDVLRTSASISGLVAGTSYDVQVRAINADDISGWSPAGTGTPANAPATGKPEISGLIEVGEVLTATTGTIEDLDGTTKAEDGDAGFAYTYRWVRVDGSNESNIAGATGSSYTLVAADEGKGIRVRVSFTDDADGPETVTSDAYHAVVILPAPRLPSVDDPNAVWMATLTVADLGPNEFGYDASQGGSLTDTAFTYLGDDTPLSGGTYREVGTLYTIDELFYHTSGGQLLLSLDGEFVDGNADNIFVDVDGEQQSFSQGTYSSTSHTYTFPSFPNPSWTAGDEVTVKIVVLAQANGPQSLAATSAESGDGFDVSLTWVAPTEAVTGYRVEHQPDPALQWRTLEASQSGTTYADSGLGRGTVRYYRVAALRSGGASYSEIVRVQAASETTEIPEQVNHVDVKPAEGSDTALEVAWNRARTPNSRAPATGYHVQYVQHDGAVPVQRDGEDWATVTFPRWMERLRWRTWSGVVEDIEFEESTERSPTLKTVVTGLTPSTNYRVRVRGCTEAGCGEWSYPRRWTTSGATLNATEGQPLTATLEDFPTNHDGSGAFTFRIAFSAEVVISRQDMKEHALTVVGGTVTRARRVDRRKDLWELTVEPAGTGAVSVLVPLERACTETGALCTADGQMLSMGLGHSVPGPAPVAQGQQALTPLAAGFVSVPAEHDGETAFWLELSFDAAVEQGSKQHIRALLGVSGGSETKIRRKDDRLDHWRVRVEPASHETVTVTLSPSPACGQAGAVCTEDGRTFTTALATQIQGPPGLTVADAEVEEAANATLAFAVTLSRPPSSTVTVGYATSDGTATADSDYTAASGRLTFAAGETEKTVSVPVLDDAHDEGSETLTLTLSNASGAHIEDGSATGTINNTDHMPLAWMVRFGRTVGSQVVDALGQRLDGATASHVTVGGIPLTGAPGAVPEAESDDPFGLPDWATRAQREASAQSLTANDLLLGSAFHLSSGGGQGAGPAYTAWGRVATSGFAAAVDDVTMDGDVTSGLVGFDAEWARILAGVMFSHSTGEGDYGPSAESGARAGRVESSLTGVYPYARVALNAWVSAWALAGAASGELTLKQEGDAPMPAGITMRMGAVGFKGRVLDGTGASGVGLDVKTDALWVGTKSEDTGELAPTEGDVTRLRLTLAGKRAFAAGDGATFTPSAEVGLRHDGGDAESGTGLEVGAGLSYVAGVLTVEGQVRTLVAHEDSGYEEWGVSGAVRITPSASGRGLMLRFAPQWGRTASAVERLWSAPDASALGGGGEFEGGDARLAFDAGYGVGLGHGRGVLTPYAGLVLGDAGSRTVRTGVRWQVGTDVALGLEGTRRTSGTGEAGNELMLRVALRF